MEQRTISVEAVEICLGVVTSHLLKVDVESREKSRSVSMIGHVRDVDPVLSNSDDDVSGTPLKYKRSNSMPHPPSRVAIDQDTFRRARFEANLIPKPPRTNSMRQSSPDQLVSSIS